MGYVKFCYRVVQNYDNFEGLILVTETKKYHSGFHQICWHLNFNTNKNKNKTKQIMTTKKHIPNSNSVNPIHVQRYTFQYIFLLESVQKWKSEKDPKKKKQISRP